MDIAFSMDDARRARAEKQGEPKHFEFGGEVFDLPVELPFAFSEALVAGEWRKGIGILLDGNADKFFGVEPPLTNEDLQAFAEGVTEVYTGTFAGWNRRPRALHPETLARVRGHVPSALPPRPS